MAVCTCCFQAFLEGVQFCGWLDVRKERIGSPYGIEPYNQGQIDRGSWQEGVASERTQHLDEC